MEKQPASAGAIAVGSLIAFFGGCIASCILAFVLYGPSIVPIFQQLENLNEEEVAEAFAAEIERSVSNPTATILFIAVGGAFALLGGYTAGRMGKENPRLNGIWVGGIVGGISLLFALFNIVSTLAAGDLSRTLFNAVMGFGQAAAVFFMAMLGGQIAGGSGGDAL